MIVLRMRCFMKVTDISILWKKAMEKKDGPYDEVVIPVEEKIVSISFVTYISFTLITYLY